MRRATIASVIGLAALAACGKDQAPVVKEAVAAELGGTEYVVRDTTISAEQQLTGIAEPYQQATVSTKVMGAVTAVLVHEGDRVAPGAALVRIDARELDAKRDQAQAAVASAVAMQREVELTAGRMRALFADSAATRAQLDAAEAALSRANAAVAASRASEVELAAVASYSTVRAPFAGVVTQRLVDDGAFVAPGSPLLMIQDHDRLRIVATAAPKDVKDLRRGASVNVEVEGVKARGTVEGVVPTASALYAVNVIVDNRRGRLTSGGAAAVTVGQATRVAKLVPSSALVHEGDLIGVRVKGADGITTRWIRVGRPIGAFVEVLAGLGSGTIVVVPASTSSDR